MITNKEKDQSSFEMKHNNENKVAVVQALSHTLADTYFLYLKTQNFHWNVTGSNFQQLHLLFESQYGEMAVAIDEIAERIRALGRKSPGTFKEFRELSSIKEDVEEFDSDQMICFLIDGNETISRKAKEAFIVARDNKDEVSSGLFVSRVKVHEKASWMLRSLRK